MPMRGPGGGGPFAGMNVPAQKAKQFRPTMRRLLARLRPERGRLLLVLVLATAGVLCAVTGPRLLGEGTNLIFSGVISKSLPAGASKADVIAQLRASGNDQRAGMLSAMQLTPGRGVTINTNESHVRYNLVRTITAGEFSFEADGILNNSPGDKTKMMAMYDGNGDITTSDWRLTVAKR
jgi:ATP-binding cassette subfamily B protein